MAYDSLMVFTGNANPKLAADVVQASEHFARPRDRRPFFRRRDQRRTARERARQGCLHPAADLRADQRQPDGTGHHGRCAEARLGRPHHRRDPLFRLCPPGSPPALGARADRRQGGGQHAAGRRRAARADGRSARRPDPGLLRHSRSTTSTPRPSCSAISGSSATTTCWWFRPTSAAWCAPAPPPSAWNPTWPSSTSAGRRPMSPK